MISFYRYTDKYLLFLSFIFTKNKHPELFGIQGVFIVTARGHELPSTTTIIVTTNSSF